MDPTTTATLDQSTAPFDDLDRQLRENGPDAAIDALIAHLDATGQYRALLDALLLKARHDLHLPLVASGTLGDLPEPTRTQFEDRYVEAIRTVGGKLLDSGDIPAAWPYFRAIAEKDPVAAAIDAFEDREGDDRAGAIIEVAFNQGANPKRGYELILKHYGACSAITAFEHLPPDESIRQFCADRLIRHLHAQLTHSLRAEITRRGQPLPSERTSIPDLMAGRDWLFFDDAYHIDISHLGAVVRIAPLVADPQTLRLAVELAEYGRKLSDRHKYDSEPPFTDLYGDHAIYLRGLLNDDAETAIAHFAAKLPPVDPDGDGDTLPAQILIRLLTRLNRHGEAIDVAADHLRGIPEAALICPTPAQLCHHARQSARLADLARRDGDLVHYTAAILQAGRPPDGS
jgi:hypothetical protein